MRFKLPDILVAEAAGRAMALRIQQPVEVGVSPCLAGAAALAAARRLLRRGLPVSIALTESASNADESFALNLEVLRKLGVAVNVNRAGSVDYPCVISGTDVSATMGSSSFLVARSFMESTHRHRWDDWQVEKNPYLREGGEVEAVSSAQAREIDRRAAEEFGLPSLCLMENAGIGAAVVAAQMAQKCGANGEIVILAGAGNNGGDAFVVARGLLEKGLPVRVVPLATDYSGDAGINYGIIRQHPQFIDTSRGEQLARILGAARLIVDGIFGTGLNRAVEGEMAQIIAAVNNSGVAVLSLDLPSGLHADTGEVCGAAVRARQTVTFAAPKTGLLRGAGPEHAGKITVADLGDPIMPETL